MRRKGEPLTLTETTELENAVGDALLAAVVRIHIPISGVFGDIPVDFLT